MTALPLPLPLPLPPPSLPLHFSVMSACPFLTLGVLFCSALWHRCQARLPFVTAELEDKQRTNIEMGDVKVREAARRTQACTHSLSLSLSLSLFIPLARCVSRRAALIWCLLI